MLEKEVVVVGEEMMVYVRVVLNVLYVFLKYLIYYFCEELAEETRVTRKPLSWRMPNNRKPKAGFSCRVNHVSEVSSLFFQPSKNSLLERKRGS